MLALLEATNFDGGHTADNILQYFKEILDQWGLSKNKCVAVVTDNGANVVSAMKNGTFVNIGCFAHTTSTSY